MNTRRNLNTKRKSRPNSRRPNFSRSNAFNHSKIVKPRGNISQVLEKYLVLAQDANSNGDKIKAEGYYQYAEHYQRILNSSGIKVENEKSEVNNTSKTGNQLSRTERAINAKLKRLNNESDSQTQKTASEQPKNLNEKEKTSDGVEALRAFATNIDPQ